MGEGTDPSGRKLREERDEHPQRDQHRRKASRDHWGGELAVQIAGAAISGHRVMLAMCIHMLGRVSEVVHVQQQPAADRGKGEDEQCCAEASHGGIVAIAQMQVNCNMRPRP